MLSDELGKIKSEKKTYLDVGSIMSEMKINRVSTLLGGYKEYLIQKHYSLPLIT